MSEEVWKPVVGYEGLYEVSNTGKVRSLYDRRCQKYRVKELKPVTNGCGYLRVNLYKEGKGKMHYVHKLVMEAFIGPRPEGYDINHRDERKTHNFIYIGDNGAIDLSRSNLEYCTHRDNLNYGTRTDRVATTMSMPVLEYGAFADIAWSRCWPSVMEAGRSGGYKTSAVWGCCSGKRRTHHGKTFRYVPVGKDADWSNWSLKDAGIA